MSSNKKKSTFNAKKLSKKQKGELAKTGSFTTSTGAKRDATGATIGGTSSSSGKETVQQTVDRAKAMLGTAYNPNTPATQPVQQTVDRAKAMLSQTKAEGATPFAGSEAEKAYLAKYPAPTDPSLIKPDVAATTIPTTEPAIGDTADSSAYAAGTDARLTAAEQDKKDRLARLDAKAKEDKPFLDKMMQSFNDTKKVVTDSLEQQDEAFNDYLAEAKGIREEIKSYNDEYATVEAAMDQQIAQSNDKMASMNFINNQTAQIRRNAEPQLNLLSAKSSNAAAELALLQGDYQMADKHLQNAVEAMTALAKFEYESAKDFYSINQDNFDRVESVYSDAYKDKMAILQSNYENARQDANTKRELILKYNADGAGIKMTDSLDEAFRKAGITNTQERRLVEAQIANTYDNAKTSSQKKDPYAVDFAPEDIRALGGSNLLPEQIKELEDDVNSLGINAVLSADYRLSNGNTLTTAQKTALQNTVKTSTGTPMVTSEMFTSKFSNEDLLTKAREGRSLWGATKDLFTSSADEVSNYIAKKIEQINALPDEERAKLMNELGFI